MHKKVIIIGPAYPLRGGLATYNERLAREFISKGYETMIYTFSLQYPNFLFPGTTQLSQDAPPPEIDIKVCINSVNPLNWLKIGNELRKIKPDYLVVRFWIPFMGPCLGTILRLVNKNHFTRIVCIADNIVPHEKRFGDGLFTKYFVQSVHAFITMSEKVLEDLKKIARGKPAQYIPHPLYDNFGEPVSKIIARNKLKFPLHDKIILFFGFIRKYKGLDILLIAMKILKDKKNGGQNIKLLIAGEYYEDSKHYLKQIENLGISDMIIQNTKFIPDTDVKYYFCAADAVVQPYRAATQSGVTPLAYHFEIPMILTNVGGLPAMVHHKKAGLIAEPTAEDIAQKIIDYFELGEDYFLPHLRDEKKRYSWSKIADAITN